MTTPLMPTPGAPTGAPAAPQPAGAPAAPQQQPAPQPAPQQGVPGQSPMQQPNEAPAVAVSESWDQRVQDHFTQQLVDLQQQQQQAQQPASGAVAPGGDPSLVGSPPVQPLEAQQPTINPFVAPAPTDTADLFGQQITREDAQLIAQTQEWLRGLSAEQVQVFQQHLQNPAAFQQQAQQPAQYQQQPAMYQQQPAQYPQQYESVPQNPNIPQQVAPTPGQFFGPPGSTGQPAPPAQPWQQSQQMFMDPFAVPQPPTIVQPPYPQQYAPQPASPPPVDPQFAQVQQQVQQLAQQQAMAAAQQQAAALKPYGDAAIQHVQQSYGIPDAEMQSLIQRAGSASQLLENAFAQSPNDPRAAYVAVMESILWADPALRTRAIAAQSSRDLQQQQQLNQQRARAGSIAASGGSIPRVDAVPQDATGRPDYRAGTVAAIRTAMSGNGQSHN